ncbi:hypothetical protein KY362_00445 [Candidatus Woesearchaeota archaeon]|nr:hypothetical protein [Candidatus Woesearchaeota archaeon]
MRKGSASGRRFCRGRKGQAAMEFLHTYGWVFASALMLGGALLYFNGSRAQYLVPLECKFLSGIGCIDAGADEMRLAVVLVNQFGFDISNISINVNGTCNSTANTTDGNPFSNPNVMLANQQDRFTFECQNLTNLHLTERITMDYRVLETGEQHRKIGKLVYAPTG